MVYGHIIGCGGQPAVILVNKERRFSLRQKLCSQEVFKACLAGKYTSRTLIAMIAMKKMRVSARTGARHQILGQCYQTLADESYVESTMSHVSHVIWVRKRQMLIHDFFKIIY